MIGTAKGSDISRLKEIWKECFGDSDSYITLFFDTVFKDSQPLAFYADGTPVAVLYRLKCKAVVNGRIFYGRYIYAAATLENYRKRGIMGQLLSFAQKEAESRGEFLSLVPGSSELYGYYSKFSFAECMNRHAVTLNYDGISKGSFKSLTDNEAFDTRECLLKDNSFIWGKNELSYALQCIRFFGGEAVSDGKSFAVILKDGEKLVINELLGSSPEESAQLLLGQYGCTECKLYTPENYGENERFGMINDCGSGILKAMEKSKIYMNLALD